MADIKDIAMTDDPWLKTSIMARRGLAMGQAALIRLGNTVDPKDTMGASILKKCLNS
jgi:hypothetical protein